MQTLTNETPADLAGCTTRRIWTLQDPDGRTVAEVFDAVAADGTVKQRWGSLDLDPPAEPATMRARREALAAVMGYGPAALPVLFEELSERDATARLVVAVADCYTAAGLYIGRAAGWVAGPDPAENDRRAAACHRALQAAPQ
ncbi:MAG: hypothetical protein M5U26_30795 [Planctomycetota bacterium]|nr:hypothetical protein [Planctomycetota bacterium]